MQKIKTVNAKKKSFPPSLFVSIPIMKMCDAIAPIIVKNPNNAPQNVVLGLRIKIAVMSSKTPENSLPKGSALSFEKMATESGCAVNLKNKVCSKIIAGINRNAQLM
jgi:hypothetical protein